MGGRGSSSASSGARIGTPEGNALVARNLNAIADRIDNAAGFVSVGQRDEATDARTAAALVGSQRLIDIYSDPYVRIIAREYARWNNTMFSEQVTTQQLRNIEDGSNRPLGMSDTAWQNVQSLWQSARARGHTAAEVGAAFRYTAAEVGAAFRYQRWLKPSVGVVVGHRGRS